jgi:hypothetical protein
MPYLYCQRCRLTIHEPRMFAMAANTCPRCRGEVEMEPAPLFELAPGAKKRRFQRLEAISLKEPKPHLAPRRKRRDGMPQPLERNLADHGDRGGV